jgi:tRNA (cytidine/uridine-2'-O-)-methyltransferase
MRIALYQPDIPQNAGTIMRMAACLGLPLELIGPAGFDASDRSLKRAGLDYLAHLALTRHESWEAFENWRGGLAPRPRLVLLTTKARLSCYNFVFRPDDIVMLGRESAGVPEAVHRAADLGLRVPMRPGLRSLNVAVAAAMVVGEALRQTSDFASLPWLHDLPGASEDDGIR